MTAWELLGIAVGSWAALSFLAAASIARWVTRHGEAADQRLVEHHHVRTCEVPYDWAEHRD